MTVYLLINIFIIIVPLFLSFESKVKFYKKFIPVSVSIFITGIIFIYWDHIAVKRGDWSFNPEYVTNFKYLNLPLEEILFFITVPFSILFIYESLKYYIQDKYININRILFFTFLILLLFSGLYFSEKKYTSTVFLFLFSANLISYLLFRNYLFSKIFILTLAVSIIPFLIVNYILTYLPVVVYNSEAILNLRFTTIPVEDFFYSVSMITCWIIIYKVADFNYSNYKVNKSIKLDKSPAQHSSGNSI